MPFPNVQATPPIAVASLSPRITMTYRRISGGPGKHSPGAGVPEDADLVCFSHLRWDFVFQRPQHLMTRFARRRRVLFVEEPIATEGQPFVESFDRAGVTVARPRLPEGLSAEETESLLAEIVPQFIGDWAQGRWIAWYYTPMALAWSRSLEPAIVVYDCMDELSAFRGAPPALLKREAELLGSADIVFTGGPSLYEAKRARHPFVFAFPSSIDVHHFRPARESLSEPPDQMAIPAPRLGFCGVLDERFDADLLREVAAARPEWHFVLIGPVVKIDPAALPHAPNIHYLGQRRYDELPAYLAGWDVALMPFALNEATRFISPTKTPEYLAAGRPVVSTPIRDVVRMYGDRGLVRIAGSADEFVDAVERTLAPSPAAERAQWLAEVDDVLAGMSWDSTWLGMEEAIELAVGRLPEAPTSRVPVIALPGVSRSADAELEVVDV